MLNTTRQQTQNKSRTQDSRKKTRERERTHGSRKKKKDGDGSCALQRGDGVQ